MAMHSVLFMRRTQHRLGMASLVVAALGSTRCDHQDFGDLPADCTHAVRQF